MSRFSVTGALAGLLFCAGAAFWFAPVAAQQKAAVPDFTLDRDGAWLMVGDELLPPPSGPGPITFDKRHPYVDNRAARQTKSQPTYRVADLANPNVKPWAKEQMKQANAVVLAGGSGYTARSSCMPAGVPGFMMFVVEPIFFVQSPKEVLMIFQGDMQVRHIYLDVPHSEAPKPSWYGESVGHYEGDTLVIDTVGLNNRTTIDNFRTPHTDKLHVVERYKLTQGGKMIDVLINVDDPGAFTTPWSATQQFRRVPYNWTEDICAENNYDFLKYEVMPLPQASKPDF